MVEGEPDTPRPDLASPFKGSREVTVGVEITTTARAVDRSTEVVSQRIGVFGRLISVYVAAASGAATARAVFSAVSISRGGTTDVDDLYKLCKGYVGVETGPSGFGSLPVTPNDRLVLRSAGSVAATLFVKAVVQIPYEDGISSWRGEYEDSLSGHGNIITISLGDPAANTEFTAESVPTGAKWHPISFSAPLVTDGNAANRVLSIAFDDGSNEYARGTTTTSHTASLTRVWYAGGGLSGHGTGANGINLTWPNNIFMGAGDRVVFATDSLQAGDDWGEGFIQVEEWLSFEE